MVCLATLAPAATAADATGFALLKRYLDGREPALPEGCVLDVELEAKELLRAAFELLTGELVDLRLAHYTHSRLSSQKPPRGSEGTPLSTTFRAKVSHSGGKPILFLPAVESVPSRPTGPTRVRLPDGRDWVFRFVRVACNVAHPVDAASGRGKENGGWHPFPAPLTDSPPAAARYTTHVPVYDLTAAAGFWGPESVPEVAADIVIVGEFALLIPHS